MRFHPFEHTRLPDTLTILHLTAPAEVGGLESVVRMLAIGHSAMGTRVHVAGVIPHGGGAHPFLGALAAEGVPTEVLALPTRAYARERAAIRELCDRLRPHVVHTHGYRSDVVDAGVARALGIPVVTTVHGFTGGGLKNRLYEWLQVESFKRLDAVVSVSRSMTELLRARGVHRDRIHTIPNAFDPDRPRLERKAARRELGIADESDEFVAGWVGRLSPEKGGDVLVDAMALLADGRVRATMVGAGPDRERLIARARASGAGERIRWRGIVPDAARLFAAFDVFVLSSRTEGIPIVLLEAMAAGVPVVSTRVGGVPDVVSAEEALLVPSEDPQALAAAIDAVRRDPAAARRRAIAARLRLERDFSLAPWLGRYDVLYRELAGRAGGRGA